MHSPTITERREHRRYYPRGTVEQRFWGKVEVGPPSACWRWTGSATQSGHGKFQMDGKNTPAARAAYQLANGPIPSGLVVRHKCDNSACVNPAHLELGTQRDNIRDMIERGRGNWRAPRGEDRHNAILTEDQVRYIRNSTERGIDLAQRFGVKRTTVTAIRKRRIWKHIT